MQQLHLTPDEKQALAAWLASPELAGKAMSFAQLEGYLFALICAPAPLEMDVWVKQVVGEDISALSEDQLFALMALHNEMSEQVFETGFVLPSYLKTLTGQCIEDQIQGDGQLWCLGFALGAVDYVSDILKSGQLDEELSESFTLAFNCLSVLAQPDQITANAKQLSMPDDVYLTNMISLMPDFALGFAELVEMAALQSGLFDQDGWE